MGIHDGSVIGRCAWCINYCRIMLPSTQEQEQVLEVRRSIPYKVEFEYMGPIFLAWTRQLILLSSTVWKLVSWHGTYSNDYMRKILSALQRYHRRISRMRKHGGFSSAVNLSEITFCSGSRCHIILYSLVYTSVSLNVSFLSLTICDAKQETSLRKLPSCNVSLSSQVQVISWRIWFIGYFCG